MLAGGGVLLAAALVALAGIVITQYLPPRARVATIGGDSVSASALVDRAVLFAILEPTVAAPPIDEFAAFTLDRLVDEAALRSAGAAEFGAPTDEQRSAELRALLGVPREADVADLAAALANLLGSVASGRALDAVVDARLQEASLRERFEREVPEVAPQIRLRRIRVSEEARAGELRERALAGEPFGALAAEASLDAGAVPGGDLGWTLAERVDAAVAAALSGLEPGGIAEPLAVGPFVELYLLEERDDARALESAQVAEIVQERLEEWLAAAREALGVERDLSPGESEWVAERVGTPAGRPPGGPLMAAPIGIALLGAGTVGAGVARALAGGAERYAARVGRPLALRGVLVRKPGRPREGVPADRLTADVGSILADEGTHVVVELMGGEEPARGHIENALRSGRHVVTANKEVMAKHGPALLAVAAERGVRLLYEAAVGGGIPIISPALARPARQRDRGGDRDHQRHHQLHAHGDGAARCRVRRRARRGTAHGLRRGRSGRRRGRWRRGLQARHPLRARLPRRRLTGGGLAAGDSRTRRPRLRVCGGARLRDQAAGPGIDGARAGRARS